MKVAELNNQPSFGMALKIKSGVLKSITNNGNLDEFKKALPELKQLAKDVDITIRKEDISGSMLRYIATPTNKFKINNPITRGLYLFGEMYKTITGTNILNHADFVNKTEIVRNALINL